MRGVPARGDLAGTEGWLLQGRGQRRGGASGGGQHSDGQVDGGDAARAGAVYGRWRQAQAGATAGGPRSAAGGDRRLCKECSGAISGWNGTGADGTDGRGAGAVSGQPGGSIAERSELHSRTAFRG